MSKGKIGIYFKGALKPLHPRILLEKEVLEEAGHEVQLISGKLLGKSGSVTSRIKELLTFSLFQYQMIDRMAKNIQSFDQVIIYDSHLLPLAKYKSKKQQVIFETLDDNVELIAYHIEKKLPFGKRIAAFARKTLQAKESKLITSFVDKVIVNSEHLKEIHSAHAPLLNYYASPLEKIVLKVKAENPPALLYLGKISLDKGFKDIILLGRKHALPIYFFGNVDPVDQSTILPIIQSEKLVHWQDKLPFEQLANELQKLSANYRLIGTSLIHSKHSSYQFQDANKDIDYLALGIPFVGNERKTTYIISKAVGGYQISDKDLSEKLLNVSKYVEISKNSREYYALTFHSNIFKNRLMQLL